MFNNQFILGMICPNRPLYCVACHKLRESPLVEKWDVDFKIGNKSVRKLLEKDGWREGDIEPLHGIMGYIADSFPPEATHKQILTGKAFKKIGADQRMALQKKDRIAREKSRIQINLTLRSPESMPLSPTVLRDFIEQDYIPTMTQLVKREYLPDDFDTTLRLLNGEEDIIPAKSRTLTISIPLPDVTNSSYLLGLAGHMDWTAFENAPEEVHFLPIPIPNPEYLHLFALLIAYYCSHSNTISWSIFCIPGE